MVAIVLPVFNTSAYLKDCIESLLGQTDSNIVIYAVDDGSTDNSLSILYSYQKLDSRLKVIHKINGGVSSARNEALKAMESENETIDHVIFVDSDDALKSDCVEKCVEYIGDAEILISSFVRFNESGSQEASTPTETLEILNQEELSDRYFHMGRWAKNTTTDFFLCNKFFALSAIKGIYFDTKLKTAEDQDFMIRVLPNIKKAVLIPDSLYLYRVRESSLSHSISSQTVTDEFLIYQKHLSNKYFPSGVRRGIQYRYLQKLWAKSRSILQSSISLNEKKKLFKTIKEETNRSFEFPLSKKQKKRLAILKLGFIPNLVFSVFRK